MQDAIGKIVTPVLDAVERELGPGFAAVLYGSAARGEHLPGVSDVNLLLVVDNLRPEALRRLSAALKAFQAGKRMPPLLLERDEWTRAVDVFPIEVTDMQLAHEPLRGEDPVRSLAVDPADLRRALEQEFRGKLLRLRQVYAVNAADPGVLGEVARRTVASVATLFRVALRLHGRPVPADTPGCLAAAGAAMGVTTDPVAQLWGRRGREGMACDPELFEGYLSAVAAAVRVIDQFTPGGN